MFMKKTYLYCWSAIHKRRNNQFVIGTTEDFVDGTIAEDLIKLCANYKKGGLDYVYKRRKQKDYIC